MGHRQPVEPQRLHSPVNLIRRENPALQRDGNLRFHAVDNEQLLCYSRQSADRQNTIVVVVNLDAYHPQSGWLELPIEDLDIPSGPGPTRSTTCWEARGTSGRPSQLRAAGAGTWFLHTSSS